MTTPSPRAVEAAKQIARNTEAASLAANGPRFMFEEYINEQALIIDDAISEKDEALREFEFAVAGKLPADSSDLISIEAIHVRRVLAALSPATEREKKLTSAIRAVRIEQSSMSVEELSIRDGMLSSPQPPHPDTVRLDKVEEWLCKKVRISVHILEDGILRGPFTQPGQTLRSAIDSAIRKDK